MKANKLLSLSFLSLIFRSLGMLGSVFFPFMLAKELPIEKVGDFLFSFSIFMFVANISRAGSDNLFIKSVAKEHSTHRKNIIAWDFVSLVFLLSTIVALLFAVSFKLHNFFHKDTIILFIGIPLFSVSLSVSFYFQATKNIFISNVLFNTAFYYFLLLVLTFADIISVKKIAQTVVLACAFSFLMSIFFLLKNVGPPQNFAVARTLKIVCALKSFFITATMAQIILWAGQIISGFWADSKDVALLIVAQRISLVISFILIAVNFVTTPLYANLFAKNDLGGIEKLSALSSKIMTIVSIASASAILMLADNILELFGDEYKSAFPFVLILCFAQLVNAMTGSVGYLLAMTNKEKVQRNSSIISASLLITLCIALCPKFGALGGAIATACAVIVQNCILVVCVRKHLGFWTIKLW